MVLVQLMTYGMAMPPGAAKCGRQRCFDCTQTLPRQPRVEDTQRVHTHSHNTHALQPIPCSRVPFHATLEDVYSAHAAYYDLPAVSFRTALWRLADQRRCVDRGVVPVVALQLVQLSLASTPPMLLSSTL